MFSEGMVQEALQKQLSFEPRCLCFWLFAKWYFPKEALIQVNITQANLITKLYFELINLRRFV